MLEPEDNRLLCLVSPVEPMHDFGKRQWLPAWRSESLEAGGALPKSALTDYDATRSRAIAITLPEGVNWRDIDAFNVPDEHLRVDAHATG